MTDDLFALLLDELVEHLECVLLASRRFDR
jgi:hypothetical protein